MSVHVSPHFPEITRLNWTARTVSPGLPSPRCLKRLWKVLTPCKNGFANPGSAGEDAASTQHSLTLLSGSAIPLLLGRDGHPDLPSYSGDDRKVIAEHLEKYPVLPKSVMMTVHHATLCCPCSGFPELKEGAINHTHGNTVGGSCSSRNLFLSKPREGFP